jgi:PAS domain S-box-containing protein
VCADVQELVRELHRGAGVILLAEEAVPGADMLVKFVARQPSWSDVPILVLALEGADSNNLAQAVDQLGNVTILERPMRVPALITAVRSALRARRRQYELRDRLAAQALLAAIVESSGDAIVSKSLDGIITSWNTGAENIFGYTAEEAIGKPITLIFPPDRLAEEAEVIQRLRRGETIDHLETVRIARDGRRIDVSLTISPVRDASNRIVGASKVGRDITRRKRAERALQEADRRKDEFLATLAHELRNPLAPIRNSLHILRLTEPGDPAAKDVVEVIHRQVNQMVRLVDDLLEISRISRGKLVLKKAAVELASVLKSAVETSTPMITAARHRLDVAITPEPLIVLGDAVRLTQVFANLLNNAAKYTSEEGNIWLEARSDDGTAVVTVRDTGAGIAPEMLDLVFDIYTQLEPTNGHIEGGLGVGLTLAKNLVELHGGRIEARSAGPGHGSEFIVRLPMLARDGPRSQAHLGNEGASHEVTQGRLDAHRILVVDDNRDAAKSLGVLLRLLGAEVNVVHNGPSALKAMTAFRPTVVLLDIGMLPGCAQHSAARRVSGRGVDRPDRLGAGKGPPALASRGL